MKIKNLIVLIIYFFGINLSYANDKNLNSKILGPINAPIYKIRKNFRNRILIRSKKSDIIQETLSFILKKFKFSPGMKLTVDVDPISFN